MSGIIFLVCGYKSEVLCPGVELKMYRGYKVKELHALPFMDDFLNSLIQETSIELVNRNSLGL